MARFDRYLLSQLMVVFGFFSLVLVMVYWINRAVVLFDRLIAALFTKSPWKLVKAALIGMKLEGLASKDR